MWGSSIFETWLVNVHALELAKSTCLDLLGISILCGVLESLFANLKILLKNLLNAQHLVPSEYVELVIPDWGQRVQSNLKATHCFL